MRWGIRIFVGLCVICPLFIGGWIIWHLHSISTPHRCTKVQEITRMLPMAFPKSSKVLDGEYILGPSTQYLIAKVKIPEDSLNQFRSQPLLNQQLTSEESELTERKYPELAKRGWKLDSIKKYLAGNLITVQIDGQMATLNLKIDLDYREYAIVYLYFIN
jgi:hypothetical protein